MTRYRFTIGYNVELFIAIWLKTAWAFNASSPECVKRLLALVYRFE